MGAAFELVIASGAWRFRLELAVFPVGCLVSRDVLAAAALPRTGLCDSVCEEVVTKFRV